MNENKYQLFFFEAAKITLFCLVVTGLAKWSGASNKVILVLFNMAVMSCAATFSPEKKSTITMLLGSTVIVFSILIGALVGFYQPQIAQLCILLYVILAFSLPKTTLNRNIFVTGALMFLIFSALPFNLHLAIPIFYYSLGLIVLITAFYLIFDKVVYKQQTAQPGAITDISNQSILQ